MNKRKLSIGLVSGVIGVLALAGCGEVTRNADNVVSFKGYQGEIIPVVTNSIYNKYRTTSDGISKFYNACLETIVRYEFDSNPTKVFYKKNKAMIEEEAANNVKNAKSEADENHNTNGTSYDTEWEAILDSYGCEDEAELKQYFIYQLEKTELTDYYFSTHRSSLVNEYIGVNGKGESTEGEAKAVYPYHIRHVLVSVSGGTTNYYNGTISQDEAKNLGNTMKALLDTSFTFSDVATKFSGDSGSAAKGGDVGIMSTTTSFVNEFKLGIYAYDAILSGKRATNTAIEAGLGLSEEITIQKAARYNADGTQAAPAQEYTGSIADYFKGDSLVKVPYGVFTDTHTTGTYTSIGELYDAELDDAGKKVNSGNEHYYPRNILWNLYLNHHEPFVITNEKLNVTTGAVEPGAGPASRFNSDGYLTDENGNVIIGVRSEHGIHFMIMQKSIYDFSEGGKNTSVPSLAEYYTTYVPGDYDEQSYEKSYPYYMNGDEMVDKATYVNYIKTSDKSEYTTRATEIKNAIKSFDSNYDYRLYKLYADNDRFIFNKTTDPFYGDLDLGEIIENYIESACDKSSHDATKTLSNSWSTYIEALEAEYENRVPVQVDSSDPNKVKDGTSYRLIPGRCAIGFKNSTKGTEWTEKGGICYYAE